MSESEPSNFGRALEPFAMVLLDCAPSSQQRAVSGHQDSVLAVHSGDDGSVTGKHRLEILVGTVHNRWVYLRWGLSACCSLCPEYRWQESTQEKCGNDSVHFSLLVNSRGPQQIAKNCCLRPALLRGRMQQKLLATQ